jgi:hypothetical protein
MKFFKRNKPETGRTHDYSGRNRTWGHDYVFSPTNKTNKKGFMRGWGYDIKVGDYIILDNGMKTTRYRVTDISYYSDPSDMWLAQVVFDPRKDN